MSDSTKDAKTATDGKKVKKERKKFNPETDTPKTYILPVNTCVTKAIKLISERCVRSGKPFPKRQIADRIYDALSTGIPVIRQYWWNPKRYGHRTTPRVCLMGVKDDHTIYIGWSAIHPDDGVMPDKKLMGAIAYLSAGDDSPAPAIVMKAIHADHDYFINRCKDYFHVRRVVLPNEFVPVQPVADQTEPLTDVVMEPAVVAVGTVVTQEE